MVWYPSDRLFSPKGILLGGYAVRDDADVTRRASHSPSSSRLSRAAIEGLHPGRGHEIERPMAIAWSKVPYSLGIAAR